MSAGIEVGVDAKADRRAQLHPPRDLVYAMQLGAAFDVDHQDAGFEGGGDFLVSLADSGEYYSVGRCAHAKASHQLAHGNDVESGAHRGEQFEDTQVGQRLHREAHEMVGAGESLVEHAEMALQGAGAVEV